VGLRTWGELRVLAVQKLLDEREMEMTEESN
jgi:hypothetical protein